MVERVKGAVVERLFKDRVRGSMLAPAASPGNVPAAPRARDHQDPRPAYPEGWSSTSKVNVPFPPSSSTHEPTSESAGHSTLVCSPTSCLPYTE